MLVDIDNFPGISKVYGNITPNLLGFNHGNYEFSAKGEGIANEEFLEWFTQKFK
ncbi:hypothetical protein [Aquisalibacillus elongatus]|uniref:hypothetical protein n=1 Tax=Aquisalibacillus elongatus TaxID=485577 RepID=UPI001472CF85|nr:hypothetical protein [Aquisalibacillus elongatus]